MEPSEQIEVSGSLRLIQATFGFLSYLVLGIPYLRRVHGLEKLNPQKQYLLVSNHVSLLDTIMLGGLLWYSGAFPILVLGDKNVWEDSWLRRTLSRPIGFLLDRGKLNPGRIRELQEYGRHIRRFNLVVFPEGTRGNGLDVAECQPGVYHVAQEARAPIVPVFIENMQLVSTKKGKFHPISGLQKVEIHYGEPIPPEKYLSLSREEFSEFLRNQIRAVRPTRRS